MASSNILNELLSSDYHNVDNYNKADIKTRGDHLISSVINLLDDVNDHYGEDVANMLERRFIASIKTRDPKKFKFNKKR